MSQIENTTHCIFKMGGRGIEREGEGLEKVYKEMRTKRRFQFDGL